MKNRLWKTLFITLMLGFSCKALAQENFKCGEYDITGVVKKSDGKFVLKLFEGSMSEITLALPADLEAAAQVYENKAVLLKAKMMAPVKDTQGSVVSLLSEDEVKKLLGPDSPYSARFLREDIKERVPDPLHPDLDSGMMLTKELSCDGGRTPSSKRPAKSKK
ncbi:hypothetical protein EZJ49_05280 [Bdellovibrio bacteriovorus]|uniref:hypothetical protein n=1 Tax=Bdellovibrio bacteriovorus TaxID=959 RepID=UPI0021D017AA|nr:hypothetical protein [Bdellovibrio bacteriovorus]UXR65660.1 hypothetical protein EZJ49_05280 [Bdellovibrio bacteriovorus]